jgi:hypothetical protein
MVRRGSPGEVRNGRRVLPRWFYPEDHADYRSYLEERDLSPMTADHLREKFPSADEFQAGALDDRPVEASFTRFITECAIGQLSEYVEDDAPFYQSVHYFGPHNP